jgi:SH3-like domain-containing protein
VSACTGEWCRVYGEGFDGWIQQDMLFGVYPGEQFD